MKILVETERLILREILITDVDGFYELDSDPEVHKYLGNTPVTTKEQCIAVIQFIQQQYINNGIGRWAVINKTTNEFMGWAGLKLVTETTNNHINYYDLGYRFIKHFWGKGFATECATASLQYAFNTLKAKEVFAMADCENLGSDRVLRKAGLNFIETFYFEEVLHNWYNIQNNELLRL